MSDMVFLLLGLLMICYLLLLWALSPSPSFIGLNETCLRVGC